MAGPALQQRGTGKEKGFVGMNSNKNKRRRRRGERGIHQLIGGSEMWTCFM